MNRAEYEELADSYPDLPIPATPENIAFARKFMLAAWDQRAEELGRKDPPDLSDSCKFSSQFARIIFGGELQGNVDHQFIRLPNGRILDLNMYADDVQHKIDHPHIHDPEFFGNPEHEKSMASCRGRVFQWVEDFRKLLKARDNQPPAKPAVVESFDTDPEKPGQFVGVKFSPRTVAKLVEWCKANDVPNREDAANYHTTVILSRARKFKYDPLRWNPPLRVEPTSFKLDLFGPNKDKLVLTYDCAELDARHWAARVEHKLSWDFPEYIPHITLCNFEHAFQGDISKLPVPDFPLEIVAEYVKDFE